MKTAPIQNNIMKKVEILRTAIMGSFDNFVGRISSLQIQDSQVSLKLDILDDILLNFARVIDQDMQWFTYKIDETLRNYDDEQQTIKKSLQFRISMYTKNRQSKSQKIAQKIIIINKVPQELIQFSSQNPEALFMPTYKQIGISKIQQICYKEELYNLQEYFCNKKILRIQINKPQLLLQLALAIYELNLEKYINPSNIAIIREDPLLIQIQKRFWEPSQNYWKAFNCKSSDVYTFLMNFSYIISSDFRLKHQDLHVSEQITHHWVKNDPDSLAQLFKQLVNNFNNKTLTNIQDVLLRLIKFINQEQQRQIVPQIVSQIKQSNGIICLKHNKIQKYTIKENSACVECLVELNEDPFEFIGEDDQYLNKSFNSFQQKLQDQKLR